MFDLDKAITVAGIIGAGIALRVAMGTGASDGVTSWDILVGGMAAIAVCAPAIGFLAPLWRRLIGTAPQGSNRA
jgi:hypothetical protein